MESDDAESIIEFPVGVNVRITKAQESKIKYHISSRVGSTPIPVFNTEGRPFDVHSTLESTVECPLRYLSRAPPEMVVDNYCFVVDGDSVPEESITSGEWWKPTSVTTRFYCSENQIMRTFKKVHVVHLHGEMRAAFVNRAEKGGMDPIPLKSVFRVSRFFCYWCSCKSFHRIVSIISPVTNEGKILFGFRKRIFVQYLWRTPEGLQEMERQRVATEYKESMKPPENPSSSNYLNAAMNRRFSTIVRKLSSEILPDSPSFV